MHETWPSNMATRFMCVSEGVWRICVSSEEKCCFQNLNLLSAFTTYSLLLCSMSGVNYKVMLNYFVMVFYAHTNIPWITRQPFFFCIHSVIKAIIISFAYRVASKIDIPKQWNFFFNQLLSHLLAETVGDWWCGNRNGKGTRMTALLPTCHYIGSAFHRHSRPLGMCKERYLEPNPWIPLQLVTVFGTHYCAKWRECLWFFWWSPSLLVNMRIPCHISHFGAFIRKVEII